MLQKNLACSRHYPKRLPLTVQLIEYHELLYNRTQTLQTNRDVISFLKKRLKHLPQGFDGRDAHGRHSLRKPKAAEPSKSVQAMIVPFISAFFKGFCVFAWYFHVHCPFLGVAFPAVLLFHADNAGTSKSSRCCRGH